jgi:hypothetical protein
MPLRLNLAGKRFGQLVCIEEVGRKNGRVLWRCKCDCGNESIVTSSNLKSGHIKSCGCARINGVRGAHYTHGLSTNGYNRKTHLYSVWVMMRQRCLNPKNKAYNCYGGRGIKICKEWEDYKNFHDWAMANGYRSGLTIERINNDSDYEPSNCRWATYKEQGQNTRRNLFITFRGTTKTLKQWAEHFSIDYDALRGRLGRGWPIEIALTTPSRVGNRLKNILKEAV